MPVGQSTPQHPSPKLFSNMVNELVTVDAVRLLVIGEAPTFT